MNRLALAGLLAMASCGCARGRAAMPPRSTMAGPVGIQPMEPIRASINEGKVPADPGAVRASYEAPEPEATEAPPNFRDSPPRRAEKLLTEGNAALQASPSVAEPPPDRPAPEAGPGPAAVVEPVPAPEPPPAAPLVETASLGDPLPPLPASPAPVSNPPQSAGSPPSSPDAKSAAGAPPRGSTIGLKTEPGLAPGRPAAMVAARVGDTIITFRELDRVVADRIKAQGVSASEIPPDQLNMIAKTILEDLIDNTMIVADARKEMKKPQQWQMFSDHIEKVWKERELPRSAAATRSMASSP